MAPFIIVSKIELARSRDRVRERDEASRSKPIVPSRLPVHFFRVTCPFAKFAKTRGHPDGVGIVMWHIHNGKLPAGRIGSGIEPEIIAFVLCKRDYAGNNGGEET